MRRSMAWGALVILLSAGLTGLALSGAFLEPIREVAHGLIALETGDTRFRLTSFPRDEFGDLAVAFNTMMENLHEVAMGRLVQAKLFPQEPLVLGEYRVAGLSRPATELGGDYFDYHVVGNRHLLVIIADVSGHGVAPALVMAMAKSLVTVLCRHGLPAETTLGALNTLVWENMRRSLLMTLQAVWIDTQTHEAHLINAGHPYPFLISPPPGPRENGAVLAPQAHSPIPGARARIVEPPPSIPLGFLATTTFTPHPVTLGPGDRLGLFSDGPLESFWEGSSRYKSLDQFGQYLAGRPPLPLEAACRDVLDAHPHTRSGRPQPDDFTVVLIERLPAETLR